MMNHTEIINMLRVRPEKDKLSRLLSGFSLTCKEEVLSRCIEALRKKLEKDYLENRLTSKTLQESQLLDIFIAEKQELLFNKYKIKKH